MEKLLSLKDEANVLEQNAETFMKDGSQNSVQALRSLDRALTLRLRAWKYVQNMVRSAATNASETPPLLDVTPADETDVGVVGQSNNNHRSNNGGAESTEAAGGADINKKMTLAVAEQLAADYSGFVRGSAEKYVVTLNSVGVMAFREGRFEDSEQLLESALKLVEDDAAVDYFPKVIVPTSSTTSGGQPAGSKPTTPALLVTGPRTRSAAGAGGGVNIPLHRKLKGSTLNNFGCLERRRGNWEPALAYMKQSVNLCGSLSPITLLNMSAVCSQLGRSDDAVGYSKRALDLLTSGLVVPMQFNGLAAVAHHNLALAMEQVDPTESHAHYKKALETARKELGNGSPTTGMIQRNLSAFVKQRRESLMVAQQGAAVRGGTPSHQQQRSERSVSLSTNANPSANASTNINPNSMNILNAVTSSDPLEGTFSEFNATTGSMATGILSGSMDGEEILQSVDMSTAVLMDTQRRGKSMLRSTESIEEELRASAAAMAPHPPGSRGQSNAPSSRHGRSVPSSADGTRRKSSASPPSRGGSRGRSASGRGRGGAGRLGSRPPSGESQGASSPAAEKPVVAPTKKKAPGAVQLGAPLPVGIAAGEPHKDEEERRKEDMVTYLYGRLKDLVKHEDYVEQRYQAAVMIQKRVRIRQSRACVKRLRKKRNHKLKKKITTEAAAAAIIIRFLQGSIQQKNDDSLRRQILRNEERARIVCAIRIQTAARRYNAKVYAKRLRLVRDIRNQSIRVIQAAFRRTLSKIRYQRMVVAKQSAVVAERLRDRQTYGAFLIQKVFRSHRSRIRVLLLKGDVRAAREMDWQSNRDHAVKKIQKLWRGFAVRKVTSEDLKRMKKRREIATRTKKRREGATRLQQLFRGHLCRMEHPEVAIYRVKLKATQVFLSTSRAVVTIQCAWRSYVARRRATTLKTRRFIQEAEDKGKSHAAFVPPEDWHLLRREKMLF